MLKTGILLIAGFVFVLLINASLISFNLIYAEQPMLYTANQTIHSFSDLISIYMHPKMLDVFSIPFFRPSGHFLLYQLLAPWLGWHNNRSLIIVNLLFLTLTCWVLNRLYAQLFPGFKIGGYLACAIYLMHPALMLSRLIVLHFEFAYVFFSLLSLYSFMLFCKKAQKNALSYGLLITALFSYVVAVTFKEPAIMLGPLLFCYLGIFFYSGQSLSTYFASVVRYKMIWQTALLIFTLSLSLALYLSLAWPSLAHPLQTGITIDKKIAAAKTLLSMMLGIKSQQATLYQANLIWREVIFTPLTRGILYALGMMILGVMSVIIIRGTTQAYIKSLSLLWLAAFLFLLLPIYWAMGLPWHLSLTLIFFSLAAGFAFETGVRFFIAKQKIVTIVGSIGAVLIALNTITVNQANLHHLVAANGFAFSLAEQAVFYPPPIKNKLNNDTVLVVADSILHDGYALGNSKYPLFLQKDLYFDALQKAQAFSFLKYQPIYNGYLFRFAYLLPELQEEVYPFAVDKMDALPDSVIYRWLQQIDNIVCLDYDKQARWHDKTTEFKKNLLAEQKKRLLRVNAYTLKAASLPAGNILYTKTLNLPDYPICQYECDQNIQCKGFTYENIEYRYYAVRKCQFYDALTEKAGRFCAACISFIKTKT